MTRINPPSGDVLANLDAADMRLRHVFALIPQLKTTTVDFACLYIYSRDTRQMKLSAVQNNAQVSEGSYSALLPWIERHLTRDVDRVVYAPILDVPACELQGCIVYPLVSDSGDVLGIFFFFYRYALNNPQAHVQELKYIALYAQTVLQNEQFVAQLVFAQAVFNASQAIIKNPAPDNIIAVLRDYVFDGHITNCALGLFSPGISEIKQRKFESVQIIASWSREFGDNVSVGDHIPISYFHPYQTEVDEGRVVTLTNVNRIKTDPNIPQGLREILIQSNVQTLNLLFLTSESRPLGVMFLTSDDNDTPPLYEMQVYKSISDLLTLSVVVNELKRYLDNVTQGRSVVLESVLEAIVLVSPDDARIFAYNQQFVNFLETSLTDLRESCLWDILPMLRAQNPAREQLQATWQAISPRSVEIEEGEIDLYSQENTPRAIKWYTAPVYRAGHVVGRIYTFYDVTQERDALRFQHELWMRISHEFRTPLTSLMGYSQLLLSLNNDELVTEGRDKLKIIHSSARRMSDMLKELLDMSQATMGETILLRTHVNLSELMGDVHTRLALQFKEKGQQTVLTMPTDLPTLFCDQRRIDQVMSNLFANAIKYAPPNSKITAEIRLIAARNQLPKHTPLGVITPCLMVSVSDEGVGISQKDIEKIFVPFYRTDYAKNISAEGVGLGLAICKTFVELHHGKIWATPSTPKKGGGHFYFTLPLEPPA
ncbi:MAG: HAMP domain-containing sensor histidine kinase [bacterium]|nr:HAMP domain-containing sensor histidine kinase [bacterium]